ncbi:protein lin-37 homolog [Pectinophora gossypiella]|uniref:Protein lin-37 homolog n=1 Tax=Pectinophora gossypiella TaxID=13191 RepID=A0A1E1W0I7_PECGO|nr:protein lin-37 homolog [Pectinophora gossypiella]
MPKRRRNLLTPKKKVANVKYESDKEESEVAEVSTPRGRLKGALKDALDPTAEESDTSVEQTPVRRNYMDDRRHSSRAEEQYFLRRKPSPVRQPYVLKLFDRSVDLSQFDEESPLYPICRAWIANQPKMNYNTFSKTKFREPEPTEDSVVLPGPEGPPVSRIPKLLPEQEARNKNNINLNYREAPPPSREALLAQHSRRWAGVRQAWMEQASAVEARYEASQQLLNKIHVNAI